jgi:hypothetical protein
MAVLHDSDTRLTTSLPPQPTPNAKMTSVCAGHWLGGAPAGIEPATPSLPWIGSQAPCYPPSPQVARNRKVPQLCAHSTASVVISDRTAALLGPAGLLDHTVDQLGRERVGQRAQRDPISDRRRRPAGWLRRVPSGLSTPCRLGSSGHYLKAANRMALWLARPAWVGWPVLARRPGRRPAVNRPELR